MSARRIYARAATLALAAALTVAGGALSLGCSSSDDNATAPNPDGGGPGTDSGPSPDGGAQEFTTFVKGLIENQTMETNQPTTIADKTFVDGMDPNAFPATFFQ